MSKNLEFQFTRNIFMACILPLLLIGCGTFTPPAKMSSAQNEGTYWLDYASERRGGIIHITKENSEKVSIKICAEPAPDSSKSGYFNGTVKQEDIENITLKAGSKVVVLPGRNSNVLTLREALYRLCELSINRPEIPEKDLINSYDKVILAITRSAQAEADTTTAAMQAILNADDSSASSKQSAAATAERSGFEHIINGNYHAALESFNLAEKIYPGYHNVFEIGNALKKALSDETVSPTEEQTLLKNIKNDWYWKVPKDIMEKIDKKIN